MSDGGERRPEVSLITAVRNGAGTLERMLLSVQAQTHQPIDHVVIDGGSDDGTVEIIRRHQDHISFWLSEPDRGISEAFNKGLTRATGTWIGFLNADDWVAPEQIEKALTAARTSGADFVFGDLLYHDREGRRLHRIKGDPHYARRIRRGMPDLNHPTLLAHRRVFAAIGGFDLRYRAAMDYDWLLRAHLAGFAGRYEPKVVGHMTLDGISDRAFVRALAEVRHIAQRQGQPATLAQAFFVFRVVKGLGQRGLKAAMPAPLHGALRRLINRSYTPLAERPERPGRRPTSESRP